MRIVVSILVAALVAGCTGAPGGTPPASASDAGDKTPAPTLIAAPTATTAPTPAATEVAPGITAWTTYTSTIYGITFGYPDGWTLEGAATRKWRDGDDGDAEPHTIDRSTDSFLNPESRDGDQVGLGVWQMAAGAGADISTRKGLVGWFQANLCDDEIDACKTVPDLAVQMCLGKSACLPALLVPLSDSTQAVFGDAATGMVTVVSLGRPDDFAAAARYGGVVQLLKSILSTMDVWPPEAGQIP